MKRLGIWKVGSRRFDTIYDHWKPGLSKEKILEIKESHQMTFGHFSSAGTPMLLI